MNEYELIYEELCERVECGELSLEDAEIINDVAYDRYVTERNVYDKIVDRQAERAREYAGKLDRYDAIAKANRSNTVQTQINNARNKYAQKYQDENYPDSLSVQGSANPSAIERQKFRMNSRKTRTASTMSHIRNKQDWMQAHGNAGASPEEKYQAGRYLDLQNKMR